MEEHGRNVRSKRFLCLVTALIMICSAASITGTIAWFTDEVTSAGNVISTGTLKVELYHTNPTDTNEQVSRDVSLFDALSSGTWEPGAVVYENFTVKNAGTLALKYQLDLKVDQESIVGGHKLSEAVQYAIVPGGIQDVSSRSAVIAAGNQATGGWRALADRPLTQITGELTDKTDTDTWGIILYWLPTANDNLFNMKNDYQGMTLDMDVAVKLTASQHAHESDAFGNTYDTEADFVQALIAMPEADGSFEVQSEDNGLKVSGRAADINTPITVKVEDTIDQADDPADTVISAVAYGQTLASYDIEVTGFTGVVAIELQMVPGLSNVTVFHKENEMENADTRAANTFTYDAVSGILTLYVDHFSAFHFIYTRPGHNTGFKPSQEILGYIKAMTDDVDLRDSAGPSNKPAAQISAGTVMPYYGAPLDNEGNAWFYVQFQLGNKKHKGYIKGDENIILCDEHGNSMMPTATPTEAPAVTPSPTAAPTLVPTATPMPTSMPTTTPVPTTEPTSTPTPEGYPFTWQKNGNAIVITGYIGTDTDVIIPETIQSLPVVKIGHNAFNPEYVYTSTNITSIRIPDCVETIEFSAFENCSALTQITLPSGLIEISGSLFSGCSMLRTIDLPVGITKIGYSAFSDCSSLSEIVLPPQLKTIEYRAFQNCSSLTSIGIPSNVETIGFAGFSGCSNLTSVELSSRLTSIASSMFSGCTSLNAIEIPVGVITIEENAFFNCSSLKNVVIPNTVKRIGSENGNGSVFNNCTALERIVIPEGVEIIEQSAFSGCENLADVSLPGSLKAIDEHTFSGCESLESIIIPNSVEVVATAAFWDCDSLKSIRIPSSVKEIGETTFWSCDNLATIILSEGLQSIGMNAFGNTAIKEITLPTSLTDIGDHIFYVPSSDFVAKVYQDTPAFRWCKENNVNYIVIDENGNPVVTPTPTPVATATPTATVAPTPTPTASPSVPSIPENVVSDFQWMKNSAGTGIVITKYVGSCTKVRIPAYIDNLPVVEIGEKAFYMNSDLAQVVIPDSVTQIGYMAFYFCNNLSDITLPDKLNTIKDRAFEGCSSLTAIAFPSRLQYIYFMAFSGCTALDDVMIPASVTHVGAGAFSNCLNMDHIDVAANNPSFVSVDGVVFTKAGEKALLHYPSGRNGTYTIPAGTALISSMAFYDHSGLTGVLIPTSVTKIVDNAFAYCENLTAITIPASVTSMDNNVFTGCNLIATVVVNSFAHTYCVEKKIPFILVDKNGNLIPDPDPNAHTHLICGDASCTHDGHDTAVSYTEWDGTTTLSLKDGVNHIVLTGNPTKRLTIGSGTTVNLCLNGHTFSAANYETIKVTNGGILNLCDCTGAGNLKNTGADPDAFALRVEFGSTANLYDVSISDCVDARAISVVAAEFNMYGGEIADNRCNSDGGAIYSSIYAGIDIQPKVYLNGVRIANNDNSYSDGYATIRNDAGILIIENSMITDNTSTCCGAIGLYGNTSVAKIINTQIIGNSSSYERGAGIYANKGTLEISGSSIISNNSANGVASNVYLAAGQTITSSDALMGTIGITTETVPSMEASVDIMMGANESDMSCLVSDAGYDMRLSGTTVQLFVPVPFTWEVNEDGNSVTITGYTGTDPEMRIPAIIDGKAVTAIGESAFKENTLITLAVIPDSVTSMGSLVFSNCSSLTTVKLSNALTIIPWKGFEKCVSLESICIPAGIKIIGSDAFYECTSLQTVELPSTVTTLESSCFWGCEMLVDIEIPASVKTIENHVFYNCASLQSISIPVGITNLPMSLFMGCTSLENIEFGSPVTYWNSNVLSGCTSLNMDLRIPDNTTYVGYGAFDNVPGILYCTIGSDGAIALGESDFSFVDERYPDFHFLQSYTQGLDITRYTGSQTDVVIAGKYATNSVYRIHHSIFAENRARITSVVFQEGVKEIDEYTFEYCPNLKTVSIPGSVNAIQTYTFRECPELASVTIGEGLKYIHENAFSNAGCQITLPRSVESIHQNAFLSNAGYYKYRVYYNSIAHQWCINKNLNTYTLIDPPTPTPAPTSTPTPSPTSIPSFFVWEKNANDEGITITGYTGTGTTVQIPAEISNYPVTAIGTRAFSQNNDLKKVVIPDCVTTIGNETFMYCSELVDVNIPSDIALIGDYAFYGTGLTEVTIPGSIEEIGAYAFGCCAALTSLTLQEGVEVANEWAFSENYNLANVTLPTSLTSIEAGAFASCENLKNIVLPDGIKNIGPLAFYYTGLTSITIPANVNHIDAQAFEQSDSLAAIHVASQNSDFKSVDGVLFSKDGKTLKCYPAGRNASQYSVPAGVTDISPYAFYRCTRLQTITLPSGLASIGLNAFCDCSYLRTLVIPKGVTSIGSGAFSYCSMLTSVNLPDSVTNLGNMAFSGCSNLTSINIPKGVTSLGYSLFGSCSRLTDLTIPDSVNSIGKSVFSDCYNLTRIVIPDSVTTIEENAFYRCNNLTVFCNEGSYAYYYCVNAPIPWQPID